MTRTSSPPDPLMFAEPTLRTAQGLGTKTASALMKALDELDALLAQDPAIDGGRPTWNVGDLDATFETSPRRNRSMTRMTRIGSPNAIFEAQMHPEEVGIFPTAPGSGDARDVPEAMAACIAFWRHHVGASIGAPERHDHAAGTEATLAIATITRERALREGISTLHVVPPRPWGGPVLRGFGPGIPMRTLGDDWLEGYRIDMPSLISLCAFDRGYGSYSIELQNLEHVVDYDSVGVIQGMRAMSRRVARA